MPINVMQNDSLHCHPDSDFCKCPTCDHLLPNPYMLTTFNLIMLTVFAEEKEFFNNLRMNN